MSRLAKKPILLPQGVTATTDGNRVLVKGPHGELSVAVPRSMGVEIADGKISVSGGDREDKRRAMLMGTLWALLRNSVVGVSEKFSKILEIEGVGYKVSSDGKDLVFNLGYANPVRYKLREGISAELEKNTIKISGLDKEFVGKVAAEIRSLKKPEPYKGKGIHYRGEVIRRKAGKKAAATAK